MTNEVVPRLHSEGNSLDRSAYLRTEMFHHPATMTDPTIVAAAGSVGVGLLTASAALLGQRIAVRFRGSRRTAHDARQAALRVERREVLFEFLTTVQDVERLIDKWLHPLESSSEGAPGVGARPGLAHGMSYTRDYDEGIEAARLTHQMQAVCNKIELLCAETTKLAAEER
jgi:hypothetical protein